LPILLNEKLVHTLIQLFWQSIQQESVRELQIETNHHKLEYNFNHLATSIIETATIDQPHPIIAKEQTLTVFHTKAIKLSIKFSGVLTDEKEPFSDTAESLTAVDDNIAS
jgi:hypothetical protein